MNKLIPVLVLLAFGAAAHAGSLDNSCMLKQCLPGDKAVTYASKSEMYWACPTRELAEYTDLVIGLVASQAEVTGTLPNISPLTGEPEYQGETKIMLEQSRRAAHVQSLDQALVVCHKGRAGIRVSIMNNPGKGAAIWVMDEKTKETFWMSAGMLDKR